MQIQIIPKVVSKYSSMSLVSPANVLRAVKHQYFLHTQIESSESAGLPACQIGRCCSCFCSWFVLVSLFSCCAFLLCLNQVHPPRYYYYYYSSYYYSFYYSYCHPYYYSYYSSYYYS